jgi:hypothetical protein
MNTWDEFGKWICSLNKGRNALPEETKKKIRQLTEGLSTTEEKTKKIYEFLQSRSRYVSIQLGIGGFQPFEASVVDQTGYGDCKALSNYTVSLLAEAGIKAHYVLIRAGTNAPALIEDFPSSQFNHAVVCVPNGKDSLWLECTSQTNPFGYAGNFTGNRRALAITEGGAKIVNTPIYEAEQNAHVRTGNVYLESNGNATAKVKSIYSGIQYETDGLNFILDNTIDQQQKWLQKNIAIPNFDINSFSMKNVREKNPSAIVDLDLNLNRLASVNGKRIFLTTNLMNRLDRIPDKIENRKTRIIRRTAYLHIDTIKYFLPENIYPEFLPAPVKIQTRFGDFEATHKLQEGSLLYVRRLKFNSGIFPPEAYQELTDFFKSISKSDNTKIVFLNKT